MSSHGKRSKTTVEKFVSTRHQFTVGQKVLDRFTVTTPALPGTLGEDYHAIDTKSKKLYVLQALSPEIANNFDFIEAVSKHLYVCGSIRENDLVPAGELLQAKQQKLRIVACQDYGSESVESRQEIIEAGGKFGVKALLGFLERAAAALDKLALAGRAHLALRPVDIVITTHGNVVVTNWWFNWDLLKAAAQGKMGNAATVQNNLLGGKHSTLAPEVFKALRVIAGFETGEPVVPGRLADQYSLALIFARTLNRGAVEPASAPLTPVQVNIEKVPFLNPAQKDILARALSQQPLDRFESCTAFLKALQWELPGGEYVPEKGFRDRLFEHMVAHQQNFAEEGPWNEFLNTAAEFKCYAAVDNPLLLRRARYIWETHFGHAPDPAAAPEFTGEESVDFTTASETPQQRFERLNLLLEELHASISTSGFAVAADMISLLDQLRTVFEGCNPEEGAAPLPPAVHHRSGRNTPSTASAALTAMRPAAEKVDSLGLDGADAPADSAAPVDPIALLDAFAPAKPGSSSPRGPVIEPPVRGGGGPRTRENVPAGGTGTMPMSGAMVSEFRESVRSSKPALTQSGRTAATQPPQSPRQKPPPAVSKSTAKEPATKPGYERPADAREEQQYSPPTLHLNEGLEPHGSGKVTLDPLADFNNFCNRSGSRLELLEFNFSYVPEGNFVMGREVGKPNERPTHPVQLSTGFFLAVGTVSNKFYKYFIDATDHPIPGHPRHPERNIWTEEGYPEELEDHPVVNVSWNDVRLFCAWLTEWAHSHELISAQAAIELPTEAQWEFACRGGPSQMRLKQQTVVSDRDPAQGNPTVQSLYEASPPLGLCGMLGNVWEWCLDGYGPYQPSPAGQPQVDPICNPAGPHRIIRGGGWKSKLDLCNPYERAELPPHRCEPFLGFRPAIIYRPQR